MLAQLQHHSFSTSADTAIIAPSRSPQLPLEILFKIIDENFTKVHPTDVESICSLSLVCRALARYCRPTLFRSVRVVCFSSSAQQRRQGRAGPGWHKPTVGFTSSGFSSFLQQDSSSLLGAVAVAIEELHLILPNLSTWKLARSLGLDNVRSSTWPWFRILRKHKDRLTNIKRMKIIAGDNDLPGLLQKALMAMMDEAPGLEMLDVCGSGVVAKGKLLLSAPSSNILCASIKYLELDMTVWEYIWDVACQHRTAHYPNPPSFPNLRGLALRGSTTLALRLSFDNWDPESLPESGKIIGGHSLPGITHLHLQGSNEMLDREHLLVLRLSVRSLRCLHLDLSSLIPSHIFPLSSFASLEFMEVSLRHALKDNLTSYILDWISWVFEAVYPSTRTVVLQGLQTHIIINDRVHNDHRQTLGNQMPSMEDKYIAWWRQAGLQNRWPTFGETNVFAFIRVWVGGYKSGEGRALRPLGRYRSSPGIELEDRELARGLCSCSDVLST
ncbi:hypothetical protein BKA70DRAFT_1571448 [Coprinopsis sp. MPI-PUGE-AT-0042]|nr:hypothetical protein BKA70DRAFT_1571448 [Coprinopsis sp. MPI-PUGE-AT-0042]